MGITYSFQRTDVAPPHVAESGKRRREKGAWLLVPVIWLGLLAGCSSTYQLVEKNDLPKVTGSYWDNLLGTTKSRETVLSTVLANNGLRWSDVDLTLRCDEYAETVQTTTTTLSCRADPARAAAEKAAEVEGATPADVAAAAAAAAASSSTSIVAAAQTAISPSPASVARAATLASLRHGATPADVAAAAQIAATPSPATAAGVAVAAQAAALGSMLATPATVVAAAQSEASRAGATPATVAAAAAVAASPTTASVATAVQSAATASGSTPASVAAAAQAASMGQAAPTAASVAAAAQSAANASGATVAIVMAAAQAAATAPTPASVVLAAQAANSSSGTTPATIADVARAASRAASGAAVSATAASVAAAARDAASVSGASVQSVLDAVRAADLTCPASSRFPTASEIRVVNKIEPHARQCVPLVSFVPGQSTVNVPKPVAAVIHAAVDECMYWTYQEDTLDYSANQVFDVLGVAAIASGIYGVVHHWGATTVGGAIVGGAGIAATGLTEGQKTVPTPVAVTISPIVQGGLSYYTLSRVQAISLTPGSETREAETPLRPLEPLWPAFNDSSGLLRSLVSKKMDGLRTNSTSENDLRLAELLDEASVRKLSDETKVKRLATFIREMQIKDKDATLDSFEGLSRHENKELIRLLIRAQFDFEVKALSSLWDAAGSGCGMGILKGRGKYSKSDED